MTGRRTGTRAPSALLGAALSALSATFPAGTFRDPRHSGPSLRMHIFGRAGSGA